jgi:hypothetical protein
VEFLIEIILELVIALIQLLVVIPIIWIGEFALFIFSFGSHKPRWDCYINLGGGLFEFLFTISFFIGLLTIIIIGLLIKHYF